MRRPLVLLPLVCVLAWAADRPSMGLNKTELFGQYLGLKRVGGDASDAIQSMDDARRLGFTYFRINAGGYCGSDFAGWQHDPEAWWKAFDRMAADATERGIRLIPSIAWLVYAFPDMAGEPLGKLVEPGSKTNKLLKQYTRELVTRFKDNPAILFWEIGNELNLRADLDAPRGAGDPCNKGHSSADDNFSTDQMIAFVTDYAAFIKSLDPNHPISSGYSRPRPAAQHLRVHPQWIRADWTRDSFSEMETWLRETHPSPIDIISIHLYPDAGKVPEWDVADLVKAAADIGKPLFAGEFGEYDAEGTWKSETPFVNDVLANIVASRIPFSAPWRWESFKPGSSRVPSLGNLDPKVNPEIIKKLVEANRRLTDARRVVALP